MVEVGPSHVYKVSNKVHLLLAGVGVGGDLLDEVIETHSPLLHESCKTQEIGRRR